MAASAIKPLWTTVGSSTALTITLASLASSTAGVGRQSTLVDNSTNRFGRVIVSVKITVGTSPTANKAIYIYGIRSNKDSTAIRDDGAGASDAAWTRGNAEFLYYPNTRRPSIIYIGSAASNTAFTQNFYFDDPGPEWGIGVVHDTAVNLNATGGNHAITFLGENPEAQ